MSGSGGAAARRQEVLLTSLAKLEVRLRERSRFAAVLADAAKRGGLSVRHAYYSGLADGLAGAASQVSDAYKTAVLVGGDPALR